ncbi:MAG: prepilin-type N-terminal cleavage/methylation domain-containing protein [Planctomycetota bacterium]|nr:prepilin-type N-terminal cleavage/methylation domain-containing protein [Planctomycetota bacterium]
MSNLNKPKRKQTGFTLTEVLIAVVLTLILLGLMIRAFAISSAQIAKGRAVLELAGQLRSTSEMLRTDLKGVTVSLLPRNQAGNASGYFEYIEGLASNRTIHTDKLGNNDTSMVYGDVDDILMFTSSSLDLPYRGRWNGQIIESKYAEIIWWTVFEDENGNGQFNVGEDLKLYRRVLLIRPDLVTTSTNLGEFMQFNDVSVRQNPSGGIVANTLSDLSDRANRFARAGTNFPHEPNYALLQGSLSYVLSDPTAGGSRNLNKGEDLILSGLSAFDVKAFDPVVRNRRSADGQVGLSPGDIGYAMGDFSDVQYGSFVDLNVDNNLGVSSGGVFTAPPGFPTPDNNAIVWTNAVFCTWSSIYESDGLDQDGDGLVDEGINGVDDNGADGPDDVNELETRPPYPYPLRGIQVTFRLVEPTTQILRQTSVVHNFVPE